MPNLSLAIHLQNVALVRHRQGDLTMLDLESLIILVIHSSIEIGQTFIDSRSINDRVHYIIIQPLEIYQRPGP